jgi:hypothetical protein
MLNYIRKMFGIRTPGEGITDALARGIAAGHAHQINPLVWLPPEDFVAVDDHAERELAVVRERLKFQIRRNGELHAELRRSGINLADARKREGEKAAEITQLKEIIKIYEAARTTGGPPVNYTKDWENEAPPPVESAHPAFGEPITLQPEKPGETILQMHDVEAGDYLRCSGDDCGHLIMRHQKGSGCEACKCDFLA